MLPGYLLAMLVIYSIVFTVGIVGNIWVIISLIRMIRRNWSQTHSTFQHISLYIISLSVVDFFVLCMIPLLMSYFVMGSWEFGFVACKLFWTVENVNKLLSVAILAIMSFERFIAVCKPFRWQCCKTSRSVCIILCSLVSSVVVLCAPIIYYARTSKHPVYSWNTTTPLYTKILCSFLPYINSAGNWIFYAALNRELVRNLNDARCGTIHHELRKFFHTFIRMSDDSSDSRQSTPKASTNFFQRFFFYDGGGMKFIPQNKPHSSDIQSQQNGTNEASEDEDLFV